MPVLPVDPHLFTTFLGIMAVMAITPGPANLFAVATGVEKGRASALVGVVGSGDLEVLLEPGQAGKLAIQVVTSVNGAEQRWQQLFERMFREQTLPALNIDIHDFGATPGVVRLRLEQGLEEVGHD